MKKNILFLGGSGYLANCLSSALKEKHDLFNLDITQSSWNNNYLYNYEGSVENACLLKQICKVHNINYVIHFACPAIRTENYLEYFLSHYSSAILPMVVLNDFKEIKQIIIGTEPSRLQGVDSYKIAKMSQKIFAEDKENITYLEFFSFKNNKHLDHLIPEDEPLDNIENLISQIKTLLG